MAMQEREIVVVGAGVIGLSVAYRLLEDISNTKSGIKYYITLISDKGPSTDFNGNKYSPDYTSFFAGAHQRPFPSDYTNEEKLTFQRRESIYTSDTFKYFCKKKWNLDTASTIKFVKGYDCITNPSNEYKNFNDGYEQKTLKNFKKYDTLDPDLIPINEQNKCKMINSYDTYVLNTPIYLSFLLNECVKLANNNLKKICFKHSFNVKIHSLNESITYKQSVDKPVIVNCSGTGLQWCSNKNDADYFPVRGQTLLISVPKPSKSENFFFFSRKSGSLSAVSKFETATITHQAGSEWSFVIQRPLPKSHPDFNKKLHFIIGGTKQENSFVQEESQSDTIKLIANGKTIFPKLFEMDWKIERVNVGLRPGRKGGSDVSLNHKVYEDKYFPIVNVFGFGGYGVECSMGAAEHALQLIKRGFKESLL
ncbi:hypothetical protein QEN19_003867 [Hanseniaspora menglaensis]